MGATVLCLDGAPPRAVSELEAQAAAFIDGDNCEDAGQLQRTCFLAQHCSVHGTCSPAKPVFDRGWIVAQDATGFCGSLRVWEHVPPDVAALLPSPVCDVRFVSDVCVAHAKRRGGIGRQLLTRALSDYPTSAMALTVQTPPLRRRGDRLQSFAETVVRVRYPLLLNFYAGMGFQCVGHSNDFAVMYRPPTRRRA